MIDSASSDGTAEVALSAGARVVQDAEVLPGVGARSGKGEAMWKGLAATTGDIVAWIDGDIEEFDPAFVPGMLAHRSYSTRTSGTSRRSTGARWAASPMTAGGSPRSAPGR